MATFRWDEDGFRRAVNGIVADCADNMQRRADRLSHELKGAPLAMAKSRLKREWEQAGGKLDDQALTELAQILTEGGRINVKATKA